MNERKKALSYALTPNLKRSARSVGDKCYSAQMKSGGTFGDKELQVALAAAAGTTVEYVRYLEDLRRRIVENALREGKKVYLNGVAVELGLRGTFASVDEAFDPEKHRLVATSHTYGDFLHCLADAVPENAVKGGNPTLSRVNEQGQDDEVVAGGGELTITGRDLAPDASAADEGVFLASVKTGERIASAEVLSSNLVEVVCRFSELPPPGRHRLVVATRCGMGGAYKVVEAGREVEVKEAAE